MFRSETMSYFAIYFARENAWEVLEQLGHLSTVEVEDLHLNEGGGRGFANQLKDAQSVLEKLREVEGFLVSEKLFAEKPAFDEEKQAALHEWLRQRMHQRGRALFYTELYEKIALQFAKLKEGIEARNQIAEKLEYSNDYIRVLDKLKEELPKRDVRRSFSGDADRAMKLDYIAGVISNANLLNFQKSVFRVTRGNVYASYSQIESRDEGQGTYDFFRSKSVVFLAFQSTDSRGLVERLAKLCDSYDVRRFEVPDDLERVSIQLARNIQENIETRKIFRTTDRTVKDLLLFFARDNEVDVPRVSEMVSAVLKQVAVYGEMNKLLAKGDIMEGRIWVPLSQEEFFDEAVGNLKQLKEFSGFRAERIQGSSERPFDGQPAPTVFKTYGFFDPFQEIVDTYGIPRYKEANPGLFTTATFPFLFGLMFGDVGHGGMLLAFAATLNLRQDWFPKALVKVRHLLLLMGIFATYCGLVYNEFFSVAIVAMPSCYTEVAGERVMSRSPGCVYPIGVDFNWNEAANSVTFINSLKMKLSIVVGVLHMTLGILLKGANAIHFGDLLLFFFEFLPQLVFFMLTFGYMVFCIVIKWLTDYSADTSKAPSIISLFINLPLQVDQPLYGTAESQLAIQQIFTLVAVLCVPTMLFAKPVLAALFRKKTDDKNQTHHDPHQQHFKKSIQVPEEEEKHSLHDRDEDKESLLSHSLKPGHEEHDFGEDLIHQAIETIEFVLGTISNTASYLRLWALSLAHSQLAKVFLDMLLKPFMLGNGNPITDGLFLILVFVMYILVTFGVLMIMDLLECFLHALRLHWVEFQNKFFKGDGVKFAPFSFKHSEAAYYLDN